MLPRILVLAVLGSLAWAQTGSFTVRGRVLTSSGQPLKKAEVTLMKQDQPMKQYGATSNAEGQFAFENLPPGQYFVRAQRRGYVMSLMEAKRVTVGPGLTPEPIELKLAPHSVITGHVTDEDGDPVANAQVQALPADSQRFPYRSLQNVKTNDLGEFRISGLVAGSYVLSAGSERTVAREVIHSGPELAVQTVFYPGTTDRNQAKAIEVAEGVQLHDMDVQLKRARAFKVRGKVIKPAEAAEVNAYQQTIFLTLQPKPDGTRGAIMGFGGAPAQLEPDGSFELRGALPGSYLLQANGQIKGNPLSRSVPVEIRDKDVDGVVISFLDGVKVDGEVQTLQPPAGFKVNGISVYLGAESGSSFGGNATAGPDGKFTLPNLAPGQYEVMAQVPGEEGYVKSMAYNGRPIADRKIEVEPGSPGKLELTVAFDTGEIDGIVQNAAGAPVAGASVAVYDEGQAACLCTHSATTDSQGRFQLKRIAPGDHFVVATSGKEELIVAPESGQDPRKDGTKVTVAAHSKQSLNLKIRKSAVN